MAAGRLIGTWGDELTTLGLPSAWACWILMRAAIYRKNFSASIAWVLFVPNACALRSLLIMLLAGRQPKDAQRYLRISIKRALQ